MKAIVDVTEEQLQKLFDLGIKVEFTEKDAIISPAFSNDFIMQEFDYINDFREGAYAEALADNPKLRKELLAGVRADLLEMIHGDGTNPSDEDLHNIILKRMNLNDEVFSKNLSVDNMPDSLFKKEAIILLKSFNIKYSSEIAKDIRKNLKSLGYYPNADEIYWATKNVCADASQKVNVQSASR